MDATATLNAMLIEDRALIEAIAELRLNGWDHTRYEGCIDAFPDSAEQARQIPPGVDCLGCQAARRFFRVTHRLVSNKPFDLETSHD